MSNHKQSFWKCFRAKDFNEALTHFEQLETPEKLQALEALYQQSESHQKPFMVSVLRRNLHDDKSFDDFYQSWFPSDEMCNKIVSGDQIYQQHFPVPVRVINGTNINDPKEIISIGVIWMSNKEEEAQLWEYLEKAKQGEDKNNEVRHDKIKNVADGGLLGIFRVETDDNLGSPF